MSRAKHLPRKQSKKTVHSLVPNLTAWISAANPFDISVFDVERAVIREEQLRRTMFVEDDGNTGVRHRATRRISCVGATKIPKPVNKQEHTEHDGRLSQWHDRSTNKSKCYGEAERRRLWKSAWVTYEGSVSSLISHGGSLSRSSCDIGWSFPLSPLSLCIGGKKLQHYFESAFPLNPRIKRPNEYNVCDALGLLARLVCVCGSVLCLEARQLA